MSSANKDMRRADLVVPYQAPSSKGEQAGDFSSTLSSTMPMAAIFTRNRYIGWASVVFSFQNWLGESEETTKTSSTPGYFSVGMSCMSPLAWFSTFYSPLPSSSFLSHPD
ncbi:hypothetical protein BX600DRAFT_465932 [Xylariales sp. PMI_506]|nr:hypothetical protein BX600DRAFT_465932 [Xylariales sp. PMI_506]